MKKDCCGSQFVMICHKVFTSKINVFRSIHVDFICAKSPPRNCYDFPGMIVWSQWSLTSSGRRNSTSNSFFIHRSVPVAIVWIATQTSAQLMLWVRWATDDIKIRTSFSTYLWLTILCKKTIKNSMLSNIFPPYSLMNEVVDHQEWPLKKEWTRPK